MGKLSPTFPIHNYERKSGRVWDDDHNCYDPTALVKTPNNLLAQTGETEKLQRSAGAYITQSEEWEGGGGGGTQKFSSPW